MIHRRLSKTSLLFSVFFLINLTLKSSAQDIGQNQQCECHNQGICQSNAKYAACNCPAGFIGTKCQTSAQQISNNQLQTIISQDYSYFYFLPDQANYYQISLKICVPEDTIQKLTNLIFLEVQRGSGKLKLEPSIYQTSPMTFEGKGDRCHIFYTHYIPIRKKLNQEYQKIIFGIAIKNNSDLTANRWVNFLQNGFSDLKDENKLSSAQQVSKQENDNSFIITDKQVFSQKITISCSYELYLVENYWGSAIIIMSAITLIISLCAFLYTLRTKHSYSLTNDEILRMYVVNPEEFVNNVPIKNDLSHFKILMPQLIYSQMVNRQQRAHKKYPNNIIKRRIQLQREQKPTESEQNISQNPSQSDLHCQGDSKNSIQKNTALIQNTCSICLLNFESQDKIRRTPCRHIFHAQCIDNWCQTTLNCPICRQTLQIPRYLTRRYLKALLQR